MRYGIISDIHSNLEALEKVFKSIKKDSVDSILCGGDIVGYGSNPCECLKIIKDLKINNVAGNHDFAVAGIISTIYFSQDAQEAIRWTQKQLDKNQREYLGSFELVYKNKDFTLVHGSLDRPIHFNYLYEIAKAPETFSAMGNDVCFTGHTHWPQIFINQNRYVFKSSELKLKLIKGYRYIINVGSVGQPRDMNPLAAYCIYDTEDRLVEIKRVAYDITSAQRKILDAGLPAFLADRLALGK